MTKGGKDLAEVVKSMSLFALWIHWAVAPDRKPKVTDGPHEGTTLHNPLERVSGFAMWPKGSLESGFMISWVAKWHFNLATNLLDAPRP